jgi:diadenosine tetraphosphate (Ap4A) HIT family hydrolase
MAHPDAECEFCVELSETKLSRFELVYRDVAHSRVLAEQDGLVVMPTLGQLFTGSLLILPQMHIEAVAELPADQLRTCLQLVAEFAERLRQFGSPVVFEHGSRAASGHACGIYHAHLHVVPVPGDISLEEVLPLISGKVESLEAAYDVLSGEETYLLFRDTHAKVGYVSGTAARSTRFGSQYFRKMLAAHFGLDLPWDWRAYEGVEARLLET